MVSKLKTESETCLESVQNRYFERWN